MKAVLLIPMVGPMQSWGTRSRFQERDTEREPSKSGVIGLLCAALGRDRAKPLDDLRGLKMGVRVDQEGHLRKDFHTTQDVIVASGKGWENQISNRYYLADAAFLVGLEGEEDLLRLLHAALANPIWPVFLGRKAHIPSLPPYLPDGLREGADLSSALRDYPLLVSSKKKEKIRLVLESPTLTHESRMDSPISLTFGRREFRERFVRTEFLPVEAFPQKEDDNVSFGNSA